MDEIAKIDLKIAEAKARVKELQAERRLFLLRRKPIAEATPAKHSVLVGIDRIKLRWTDMDNRAQNLAYRMGANTIYDLTQLTARDILRQRDAGESALQEIKDFLLQFNLTLKDDE